MVRTTFLAIVIASVPTPTAFLHAQRQDTASATVIVQVPADAKLYFDDQPTQETGTLRTFLTPKLQAGKKFTYALKAEVVRQGQVLSQTQTLTVRAGQTTRVDFGEMKAAIPAGAGPPRIAIQPPLVETYLHSGELAKGEQVLEAALAAAPKDDQIRFGLGTLRFIRAVERLGQALYRYGLRSERGQRLDTRLPVPSNPEPEALTYTAARQILQDLITDLQKVETTLAAIRDEQIKLPLRVGLIRLDLDSDGKPNDRFLTLLSHYVTGTRNVPKDQDLLIVFDRSDVSWLRGYCHLLTALAEIALAHDGQELFDCTAHIFFTKVDTPHKFLNEKSDRVLYDLGDGLDLIDVIAYIHLIRLPVKEPARLKAALGHLEQMLALSKESWTFILAETDDEYEWIPNPKQKAAIGVPVSKEMIDSWLEFVEEAQAILAGKRLIPFWRGREERGVNLRLVFTEPRPFDLVLWVQGTAATPYLEKGTLTKPEVWDRLQRVFGGEFPGFAIWFN